MTSIQTLIDTATRALVDVNPGSITPDQLNLSRQTLESLEVNDAIDQYWENLPEKPENERDLTEWEKQMHQLGKEINHQLHGFNEELSRVKQLRYTLGLPALDTIVSAAREIIRPLFNFTAQLND
jgi:hypothetical protein